MARKPKKASFTDYLDELTQKLRQLVPNSVERAEIEAIHQTRVTTRRLTAAVELLGPVLPDRRRRTITKSLRKLRKRLGRLRDLDVMLEHLDERGLAKRHGPAVERMKKQLRND